MPAAEGERPARPGRAARTAGGSGGSGSARVTAWGVGVVALVVVAFALRAWGAKSGLPYVYNADENAHFVPRAIGMFGHSLDPGYFVNPPAYTYLLHLVFGVRWGFDRAAVGSAFATDPTSAFTLGRLTAAALGAGAVGLLAVAGARLLDRRTGLVAAVVLAVAFLPVFYSHLALNDVPALFGACLTLAGVGGVYRDNRFRDHALAGVGLGLACATKYTAGIMLLPLLAAALLGPGGLRRALPGLVLAGLLALLAFLVANPYALLDSTAFRDGLQKQSDASSDQAGKLGLIHENGPLYYLSTLTWGLGWVPALAALGGAAGMLLRDRRRALVLLPALVVFLVFMGSQSRFFARWLLPVYPLLCLLAAWAAVGGITWVLARAGRRAVALPAVLAAVVLGAQGAVLSVHNDLVLARADTRQLVRDWMLTRIPAGSKIVVEPVFPDQWAADVGRPSPATPNGNRWIKFPTSRSRVANDGSLLAGPGRIVKLEDYERTTRPQDVERYRRGGYCWVITGSTQFGRAFAEPGEVPQAIAYYRTLRREADVAYRVSPYGASAKPVPFSFDASFNYSPLAYHRPGPEIVVYRLRDCR